MEILLFFLYLFLTYLFFFSFTILITISGAIPLFFLKNRSKHNWELSIYELLFISYGMGLAFFLAATYILDYLQLINFYTIYLPLLVIDVAYILYLNKKGNLKQVLRKIRSDIQYLKKNEKNVMYSFIILLLLGIVRFIPDAFSNFCLVGKDPYLWVASIFDILNNGGMFTIHFTPDHPPGFSFFCVANLLIYPNYNMTYFFMKFGFFPFLSFFLFLTFLFSRRMFKNKYYMIFFCLISVLSYSYFMERTIMFLPSSIATLLVCIGFLIILTDAPNYLLGFIIPTAYLIHNLTLFFFLMVLIIYYLVKIAVSIKKRGVFKNISQEILVIIFLTIVLLVPYFVHALLKYNKDILYLLRITLQIFFPIQSAVNTHINLSSDTIIALFISFLQFLSYINFTRILQLFVLTLIFFLPFSFFGLILKSKQYKEPVRNFYLIMKISVILIFVIFCIPSLFGITAITSHSFYNWSSYRIMENLVVPNIILAAVCIDRGINKLEKKWKKKGSPSKKRHRFFTKHQVPNMKNKRGLIILLISSSIASFIFTSSFYYEYYNTNLVQSVLFLREHAPEGSLIAVHSNDVTNAPYVMLTPLSYIYYNVDDTYQQFYDFCKNNSVDYVILQRNDFNATFLNDFDIKGNFTLLYAPYPSYAEFVFGAYKFVE